MSDMKDLRKALVRSNDGRSVIFWSLVFLALFVRSIANEGFQLDQWKYLFFSLLAFVIFCRFRTNAPQFEPKTNMWGFFNLNGFCLFLIYLEFF